VQNRNNPQGGQDHYTDAAVLALYDGRSFALQLLIIYNKDKCTWRVDADNIGDWWTADLCTSRHLQSIS